jgi:hypothetical protein
MSRGAVTKIPGVIVAIRDHQIWTKLSKNFRRSLLEFLVAAEVVMVAAVA